MDIMNNQLFAGGLLLGLLGSVLYGLKGLAMKLLEKAKARFISRVVVYDYDELFYVLEDWLARHHQAKYRNLEASYEKSRRWIEGVSSSEPGDRRFRRITYKQEPNLFIIRYAGRRLVISKDKKELEHASTLKDMLNFHYSISTWNNKVAIQAFLQQITDEYNKARLGDKISVYSTTAEGGWRIVTQKRVKPFHKVILPAATKKALLKDLDDFRSQKEWYADMSLTYKRTYGFHGPPGTGKTTIAQSIAAYLNKDICAMNLASIANDKALVDSFGSIPDNCLLVVEDIDCVFHGRTPAMKDIKITFSCLLNCLDGVISRDGLVTVISTNHIDLLDPALIRAGRVDQLIEIPLATETEISEYLSLFYAEPIHLGYELSLNMSKVQEICLQHRDCSTMAIKEICDKASVFNALAN